jgi:hypothetical protein
MLNQNGAQEKRIGRAIRTMKKVTFYHNPG